MARHRRHYRGKGHRFGDHLSPSKVLHAHVPVKDLATGGLVGLGGGLGAIYALNKYNAKRATQGLPAYGFKVDGTGQTVPTAWLPFVPAAGGVLIGLAGYYLTKKKHKGRAVAILAGSVLGGVLVSGFQWAKSKWSAQFGDYIKVRLAGYGNVLINQGALGNVMVTTPILPSAGAGQFPGGAAARKRASMGALQYAAMSPSARASAMRGYIRARV